VLHLHTYTHKMKLHTHTCTHIIKRSHISWTQVSETTKSTQINHQQLTHIRWFCLIYLQFLKCYNQKELKQIFKQPRSWTFL
jgi:hypothetical protein